MLTKRLMETLAMAIIGDSFLCLVSPRRHTSLWLSGPRLWQRTWEPFVDYPNLTRALGALGLGFGVWLAWKQEPSVSTSTARLESEPDPKRWAKRLAEAAR
jgi:hypothetical protein